jgi:fibronectin-binding autotransporter adhesin
MAAATTLANVASASNRYWDANGSTAGSGNTSGAWSTGTANWNLNSDGTGATSPWVAGDLAIFSAGSDGTGAFSASIFGTQSVAGIDFLEGTVTVTFGTLSLTGADDINVAFNRAATIDSIIAGSAGLTKSGLGTLVLGGVNSFTGGVVISAGRVSVDSDSAFGNAANGLTFGGAHLEVTQSFTSARAIALSSGGGPGIDVASAIALTLSGLISGSQGMAKEGLGTLVLSNTGNSYQGATAINDGILSIASDAVLGTVPGSATTNLTFGGGTLQASAALTINANRSITLGLGGGTIDTNGFSVAFGGTISGSNALTKAGAGTLTLTGTNTYIGTTTISAGTLQIGNGIASGSLTSNIVNNATLTFNRSGALTYGGTISGSGALNKLGTGTLQLTGATIQSGVLTVSGGNLGFSGNALTASQIDLGISGIDSTITFSGALTSATTTNSNNFRLGQGGAAGHALFDAGATGNFAGGLSMTNSGLSASASSVTIQGGAKVTFAGVIGMAAQGVGGQVTTVTVSGAGSKLVQTGASGVNVGAAATVGDGGQATINVNSGGVFDTSAVPLTVGGTGLVSINGGTFLADGDVNVNTAGGAGPASFGQITLSGTSPVFTQNVAGAVNVGAASGGSGTITINSGTFTTGTGAIAVNPTGTIHVNGGTFTALGSVTNNGTVTVTSGALSIGNGGTTGSFAGNITNNGTVTFNRSDNSTYAGVITGSGALTKSGGGILTTTGANAHTGGTTIAAGTLRIGDGGNTGSISSNVTNSGNITFLRSDDITYSGVVSGSGSLTKDGANTLTLLGANSYSGATRVLAGTLQLGNGGTGGSITGSITNSGNITFNRSDDVTHSSAISGSGSLNKIGLGTLTLLGTNTYSGGTTVTSGVLEVIVGSSLGTGGVTLGGGTLRLSSTLAPSSYADVSSPIAVGAAGGTIDVVDIPALQRDSEVTGIISGATRWTKGGAGELQLSADMTYTGGFRVTAGTLTLGGLNEANSLATGTPRASGAQPAATVADWAILDGGNLRSLNTGNGVTFLAARKGITLGAAGSGIWVDDAPNQNPNSPTAQSSLYTGKVSGAAVLYKRGSGEFRPTRATAGDPPLLWENTQLIIERGFYRIGSLGDDTGFGAVPAVYDDDAVYLNGVGANRFGNGVAVGTSVTMTTPATRGIKIGANGATFVLNAQWTIDSIISGPGALQIDGNGWTGSDGGQLILRGNNSWGGRPPSLAERSSRSRVTRFQTIRPSHSSRLRRRPSSACASTRMKRSGRSPAHPAPFAKSI